MIDELKILKSLEIKGLDFSILDIISLKLSFANSCLSFHCTTLFAVLQAKALAGNQLHGKEIDKCWPNNLFSSSCFIRFKLRS